jgi:WD40 repeat protein
MQRWTWGEKDAAPAAIDGPALDPSGSYKAAFTPDGTKCLIGGFARTDDSMLGTLSLVDLGMGAPAWERKFDVHRPWAVAISPDGQVAATFLRVLESKEVEPRPAGQVVVWSMRDGKELMRVELSDNDVRSLAFSADGRRIVAGMELGDALVWDVGAKVDARR